jgi:uncharacterized protein YecE (DUF72 family)
VSWNLGRAFVGTSGWNKKQWRPGFYPADLPQRDELAFASARLTSIEINSTFYALPKPSNFELWRDRTPDGFVFAIKGWRVISRTAFFPTAETHLSEFFESGVLTLGDKLGPILWQLPDNSRFDAAKVERFLAPLAKHPHRHAIEVRDASYLNVDFIGLLRAHSVAIVFTNEPGSVVFDEPTSDFVYVRLSSGEDHFTDGYDDVSIREWADRVNGWRAGGRDAFVYFKNPQGELPHTPHNAMRLIRALDDRAT